MEGQKHVWEGAIPLQIRLHESEVTTLPPPPPVLLLAPRVGYLPLLLPLIGPHFAASLPPGTDTPWFDYNGLPLKWYIPTGVLFDLLCAEPERPWNLTVHFRGYPSSVLIPCDGEDSVKWSFINSLKEADYIINGNCKNVMHMSQSDQVELWQSVLNANLEAYLRASSKLKLRTVQDRYSSLQIFPSLKSQKSCLDGDLTGQLKSEKVPVRLYIRYVTEDFEELEDMPQIDSWDQISYINRPLHFCNEEGKCFTLDDALRTLLPELYPEKPSIAAGPCVDEHKVGPEEETNENRNTSQPVDSSHSSTEAEIKLLRIQGIEPKLEIPISWMASNLKNPEHFLHLCLVVRSSNLV